MVNLLSNQEIKDFYHYYSMFYELLRWREEWSKHDFLSKAEADYNDCTDKTLAHDYAQAGWSIQQAIEKTLKGIILLKDATYNSKKIIMIYKKLDLVFIMLQAF